VIYDNNNPLFFETIELILEAESNGDKIISIPPFILDIYDKDAITDDFIARGVIELLDSAHSFNDEIPTPKWHPVRTRPGAPP
jgi:hypothetical protein